MADITYTVTDSLPEEISGFEQYSESDKNLIESFQINNLFDPQKHFSEIHIYSTSNILLESNSNYTGYKFLGNAQSAGKPGASTLSIDPVADSIAYGYPNGGVILLYHFINDLFTTGKSTAEFFINGISEDRTELRLLASTLDNSTVEQTALLLAEDLKNQSYFDGFRLNFGNNDLFIGINIGTIDYNGQVAVTVKLYEPLPDTYDIGSTLNIVEIVSDSVSYEIETQSPVEENTFSTLRSPNFNIDVQDNSVVPSQYLSYNDLFSYPVNNSNSQIFSVFNEKGIEISVDYTDYNDFVHFSSAQERLINFKYKLDLITSYSASLSSISGVTPTLVGASGSTSYYNGLIQGVVSNFDHYERFLYYESGSSSWPKTNNTKPYINAVSTAPAAQNWYANQISEAAYFDNTNNNLLINTIPTYLRDDANNENYLTFIHMIGQHFDNLWLYGKAVSDKYDADNRLDFGISRDLVAEALKNFGIQLYTSNRSIQDLFTTIIGQSYQSGSEQITNYITGSYTGSNAPIQPSSYDNYQKEVYKRIYHNLPLLLSSKGTERGLRALINCFGIPQDILQIKLYGGRNIGERPFYGDYRYYTSSLDKIRLDNTGSIVSGSTVSNYTSIIKRDDKYTDDLHPIEVGFSPTDNIDNYIISKSLTTGLTSFNIDDYIGDPRNLYLDNYYTFSPTGVATGSLNNLSSYLMSGSQASGSYNVQDFVRIIKFFDNTIFKMIKDFIPARSVADTGIIIKPHVLGRSKAKSVIATGSRPEYSGSIDTAFISGRNSNNFRTDGGEANTQYYDYPQTPTGIGQINSHFQEEAKYNGEISGSKVSVSDTDLNSANIYKDLSLSAFPYQINFISASNEVCLLGTVPTPFYITSSTYEWDANQFFTFTNPNCVYSASNSVTSPVWTPITFPRPLPLTIPTPTPAGYYQDFLIKATNRNVISPVCTTNIQVRFATCSMYLSDYGASVTNVQSSTTFINLPQWFNNPNNQVLQYTASYGGTDYPITNPTQFQFNQPEGTNVTITVNDANLGGICKASTTVNVGICTLGIRPKTSVTLFRGWEFKFSEYFRAKDYYSTPIQDPITGELTLSNASYPGVAIKRRTIPAPSYFSTNTTAKHKGIQAYFTFNNQSGQAVAQNSSLRYNIYELKNETGVNSSGYSSNYKLTTIAKDINPALPPNTWGGGGLAGLYLDDDSVFVNTAVAGVPDPSYYGPGPTYSYYPIVLNAPFRNTPLADENGVDFFPVAILPTELVRGYVFEAYRVNQPACILRTVVYGLRSELLTAEGPGTEPQFTEIPILANWDPINGVPVPGYPTPYNPPSPFGPWVLTKVRTWGDTQIGTPP